MRDYSKLSGNIEHSELIKKDYIPIIGLLRYTLNNSNSLYNGLNLIVDRQLKDLPNSTRVGLKHLFERESLLILYNVLLYGAAKDVVIAAYHGLKNLVK